jgi:hypothetical protein
LLFYGTSAPDGPLMPREVLTYSKIHWNIKNDGYDMNVYNAKSYWLKNQSEERIHV